MITINKQYDAPLAQRLKKEFNALCAAIEKVPESLRNKKIIQSTGGLISVADIIAYNIGWGKSLLEWYHAGLKRMMPEMPGHGFTTWNYTKLAWVFYKKYHYDGALKQMNVFHDVVLTMLDIVDAEYKKERLDKLGVWQWCTLPSGKQWPLSKWIQVNTAAPYKRAATLIRKL